jgi:DNA-binding CsgD family transcriptional regulator
MSGRHRARIARLAPQQRRALELAAAGKTNAQIAAELGISLDGAKWHFREIFAKLGVESREEAISFWRTREGRARGIQSLGTAIGVFASARAAAACASVLVVAAGATIVVVAIGANAGGQSTPGLPASVEQSATARSVAYATATRMNRPQSTPTPTLDPCGEADPDTGLFPEHCPNARTIYEPDPEFPMPEQCGPGLAQAVLNRFYGAWNRGDAESMWGIISGPAVWFDLGYDTLTYATAGEVLTVSVDSLEDVRELIVRYAGTHWTFVGKPTGSFEPYPDRERIGVLFTWRLTGPAITAAGHAAAIGSGKLAVSCETGQLAGVMGRPTLK